MANSCVYRLKGHPPGAINVEMYRLIREWTPWDIARRLGSAFFRIFSGTEENPEFIQSICSLMRSKALYSFTIDCCEYTLSVDMLLKQMHVFLLFDVVISPISFTY